MTTQIAVRLPDRLVDELDALVGPNGPTNRTEVVRQALESYVRQEHRRRIDEALVRGYTDRRPGESDEWGDIAAQTDAATRAARAAIDDADGGW